MKNSTLAFASKYVARTAYLQALIYGFVGGYEQYLILALQTYAAEIDALRARLAQYETPPGPCSQQAGCDCVPDDLG